MTDRKLLEYAAKAAGCLLPGKDDTDEVGRQYDYHLGLWVMWDYSSWDWFRPHLDEWQALRLAIRLRITPHICANATDCEGHTEAHLRDHYAATRRAIVRAAAEIGKAMP